MSYTQEQRRNIDRLRIAISRKVEELRTLPAKLKGRHPKDVARIARYVQVDIAYLQGYLAQWQDIPSYPVCIYGSSTLAAASPTVGKPNREG